MHIFLTGPRGAGKSTALSRTLALLGERPGGFRTAYRPEGDLLCLNPAWEAPDWGAASAVALRRDGRPAPIPGAFDRLGPAALEASRPWARLLVMDELGKLEAGETAFQAAVLAALDGGVPVLGAVKEDRAGTWLEGLAGRADLELYTVTAAGRDALPALLAEKLRRELERT